MTERSRSVADPKVVAHATVSLDGFIATPDDTLNWIFDYIETSGAVEDEIFSGAGALLSGDIRTTVATALATAEGKDLIVTGGDVVRQCLDAQLVDEIVLHVVPVLLGDGYRCSGDASTTPPIWRQSKPPGGRRSPNSDSA